MCDQHQPVSSGSNTPFTNENEPLHFSNKLSTVQYDLSQTQCQGDPVVTSEHMAISYTNIFL